MQRPPKPPELADWTQFPTGQLGIERRGVVAIVDVYRDVWAFTLWQAGECLGGRAFPGRTAIDAAHEAMIAIEELAT